MFRNLRLYRFTSDWPDEDALSKRLEEAAFEPCGPLTERSSGWEAVAPAPGDALARRVNGADLLRLRSQSRILPPAAIREELELRLDEFRERTGEEPGAREKRRMKAETRDALLPKTMVKSDRIHGYVDLKDRVIGIDTAQEAMAERFLRRLKAPLAALDPRPVAFREPVDKLLTRIFMGDATRQFSLGRDCRMQDAKDAGAVVRWSDFDLRDPSIRRHVSEGMRLTHLSFVYDEMLGCELGEDGVLRKMRFIGMDDAAGEDEDALARQDAEFALATGTLRRLLEDLRKALGGFA